MARKAQLKNESGESLYPPTMSGLVNRPGGGTVEEALAALGNGEALRPLYIACGAVYNEETGFYELNGLTDITEEEMSNMYVLYCGFPETYNINSWSFGSQLTNKRARTTIPFLCHYYDFPRLMWDYKIEVLKFIRENPSSPLYMNFTNISQLQGCNKLRKVEDVINCSNRTLNMQFLSLPLLEFMRLRGVKINVSIPDSPSLSLESVSYLVENAANTSAITVTVHADVLAKLQDEEGHPDWYAVNTAAQEKQISFATVD